MIKRKGKKPCQDDVRILFTPEQEKANPELCKTITKMQDVVISLRPKIYSCIEELQRLFPDVFGKIPQSKFSDFWAILEKHCVDQKGKWVGNTGYNGLDNQFRKLYSPQDEETGWKYCYSKLMRSKKEFREKTGEAIQEYNSKIKGQSIKDRLKDIKLNEAMPGNINQLIKKLQSVIDDIKVRTDEMLEKQVELERILGNLDKVSGIANGMMRTLEERKKHFETATVIDELDSIDI